MCTLHVLTVMAFHQCTKVDWEMTAVRGSFVTFDFCTCEIYGLWEESIPAVKRIRGDGGVPSSIILLVLPLFFHDSVKRTFLEAISHDYDKSGGQVDSSGVARGRGWEEVESRGIIGKKLSQAGTEDARDVTKEALVATRNLPTAVRHDLPVSKEMIWSGFIALLLKYSRCVAPLKLQLVNWRTKR